MNRYWKLLHWEINRFSKFYAVLMLITLLSQLAGVVLFANEYMNNTHNTMKKDHLSMTEYVANFGRVSLENHGTSNLWFMAPIALCAGVLLLYVFLIWYREWFGKNTFIYRLLMLPTSRMNVYLAKMTAILLFVLGLIAFQLFMLPLQMIVFNTIIPSGLRESISLIAMIQMSPYLSMLIPKYFIEFILYYSTGLMGVIVVFTAILLERSFRIKGIVAGLFYGVAAGSIFLSPVWIANEWFPNYFYPNEVFFMEVVVGLLIICGSLWFSSFLINKKVTV
ncbi:MAG: hypothetical protein WD469_04240 [Paenibacillaceae bacterium]